MAALTLCSGNLNGPAAGRTAAHWDALGLPQLVFGEAQLPASALLQLIPEVLTTADDQPCLHDVLRQAGEQADTQALLLVDRDLRPSPAMLRTLDELLRQPGGPWLAHGRAWHPPGGADPGLSQLPIEQVIADPRSHLDPPERPAWVLLPSQSLLAAPPTLSSALPEAAIWLAEQARLAGWRVLEATSACPCLRLATDRPEQRTTSGPRPHADAVVEPHRPGQPRLTLLVAAPEAAFGAWEAALHPPGKLPWELVLRPDGDAHQPGATVAAWASAFQVAQGSLLWPLAGAMPPPALLPRVLDVFDQPWVDLVLIGSSRAGIRLPARAARQGVPGTLALRREWLERAGGFAEGGEANIALRDLIRQAERHGACAEDLPLTLAV